MQLVSYAQDQAELLYHNSSILVRHLISCDRRLLITLHFDGNFDCITKINSWGKQTCRAIKNGLSPDSVVLYTATRVGYRPNSSLYGVALKNALDVILFDARDLHVCPRIPCMMHA